MYVAPPLAAARAKGADNALCAPSPAFTKAFLAPAGRSLSDSAAASAAPDGTEKASAFELGGSAAVLGGSLRSLLLAPLFLWLKMCALCLLVLILFCVGLAVWDMCVALRAFITGAQATAAGLLDNPFGILSLVAGLVFNNDAVVDNSPLVFGVPQEVPEHSWLSSLFWVGGRWWLQENARSLAALCPISFGATVLAMKRLHGR